MAVYVECDFNLKTCLNTLGLNEGGRVQKVVINSIWELCDEYIPFDKGALKDSAYMSLDGTDLIWNTPYAQYMWNGIVYEDPKLHCAGFKTEDGWRSRRGVQKVPAADGRGMQYQNGAHRGPHWVDRMLQEGGREKIEQRARKAVGE